MGMGTREGMGYGGRGCGKINLFEHTNMGVLMGKIVG
jgi:hypothetical protein